MIHLPHHFSNYWIGAFSIFFNFFQGMMVIFLERGVRADLWAKLQRTAEKPRRGEALWLRLFFWVALLLMIS